MDDPSSKIIAARTKVPVITYGESKDYDIYPISFDVQAKQMALKLHTPACEMDLVLKITGEFNVYNVMSAVGAMLAEKITCLTALTVCRDVFSLLKPGSPTP